jgi:putative peptidoglycan lipid II flippase
VMFVLGLVPFSTFQLLLRAFYALQNTRTTFLVNLVSTGTNVAANLLLFSVLPRSWKVPGLALGSSIAYTLGSVLLLSRLAPRIGGLDLRPILRVLARMLLASLIMGVVTALVAGLVTAVAGDRTVGSLFTVLAGVTAGVATYLVAARLLRIGELGLVFDMVRRRTGRTA